MGCGLALGPWWSCLGAWTLEGGVAGRVVVGDLASLGRGLGDSHLPKLHRPTARPHSQHPYCWIPSQASMLRAGGREGEGRSPPSARARARTVAGTPGRWRAPRT